MRKEACLDDLGKLAAYALCFNCMILSSKRDGYAISYMDKDSHEFQFLKSAAPFNLEEKKGQSFLEKFLGQQEDCALIQFGLEKCSPAMNEITKNGYDDLIRFLSDSLGYFEAAICAIKSGKLLVFVNQKEKIYKTIDMNDVKVKIRNLFS